MRKKPLAQGLQERNGTKLSTVQTSDVRMCKGNDKHFVLLNEHYYLNEPSNGSHAKNEGMMSPPQGFSLPKDGEGKKTIKRSKFLDAGG